MVRPVPRALPESNEITRRKSSPERWSLIADQDTAGISWGRLPGRLLYRAGWGWLILPGRAPQADRLPQGHRTESVGHSMLLLLVQIIEHGTQSQQNRNRDQVLSPAQARALSLRLQMDPDGKMAGKASTWSLLYF